MVPASQSSSPTSPPQSGQQADDYALMEALTRGDTAALARLYDKHAGLVYTLCFRVLHDRSAAEEVLLDIFHEMFRRADRYDPSRSSPLTYISTLARSRAIDRRRQRKDPAVGLDDTVLSSIAQTAETDDPYHQTADDEQRKLIRAALATLDPNHRQAIELSYFDGLSHSEIAAKLSKPLGTVKTYIRTGLIRLRDNMRNTAVGRGNFA